MASSPEWTDLNEPEAAVPTTITVYDQDADEVAAACLAATARASDHPRR